MAFQLNPDLQYTLACGIRKYKTDDQSRGGLSQFRGVVPMFRKIEGARNFQQRFQGCVALRYLLPAFG